MLHAPDSSSLRPSRWSASARPVERSGTIVLISMSVLGFLAGFGNFGSLPLVARGKVVRFGSQFSTAEAELIDKDGKLVASGRGTYFTASPKPA